MCGIVRWLAIAPRSERLDACRGLMRRPGPDDEDLVTRKTRDGTHLYPLHSRLNTIDRDSCARQPFTNRGDVLCYNGEIYNYLKARRGLKDLGKNQTNNI